MLEQIYMVILVLCNMTLVVVTTIYDWKRLSIEQMKITDRQRLERIRKIFNDIPLDRIFPSGREQFVCDPKALNEWMDQIYEILGNT